MDELEKLKRAELYISKLANGFDPISGEEMPQDTILNNVRLSRCFFYVSDMLKQVIDNGGMVGSHPKPKREAFYITEEQKESIDITSEGCYIKDLVGKINTAISSNKCKRFQSHWLYVWLVDQGYMEEYVDNANKTHRKATVLGESIGLKTDIINNNYGTYPVTTLDKKAQEFIIENIDLITQGILNEKATEAAEYHGAPWNPVHEKILMDLYKKNVPVQEIAVTLKRTESGIRARLKKLGIIEQRSDAK